MRLSTPAGAGLAPVGLIEPVCAGVAEAIRHGVRRSRTGRGSYAGTRVGTLASAALACRPLGSTAPEEAPMSEHIPTQAELASDVARERLRHSARLDATIARARPDGRVGPAARERRDHGRDGQAAAARRARSRRRPHRLPSG